MNNRATCPTWCVENHEPPNEIDNVVVHTTIPQRTEAGPFGGYVEVWVAAPDAYMGDGVWIDEPPAVMIEAVRDGHLTAERARDLARALLDAASLLDAITADPR